jgi:hypothetical protein
LPLTSEEDDPAEDQQFDQQFNDADLVYPHPPTHHHELTDRLSPLLSFRMAMAVSVERSGGNGCKKKKKLSKKVILRKAN